MEGIIVVLGIIVIVCWVASIFKNGFAMSSVGGVSVSSSNDSLNISGAIVSVSHEGKVLMGDPSAPSKGSNTISQSQGDCSLVIKGGHVVITGSLKHLKVNGKTIL